MNDLLLHSIAIVKNPHKSKFGVPRQSGLNDSVISEIVFLPEYSDENAFRGIMQYTHIWMIWGFSEIDREAWHPTVRPPRLGGKERVGVFATRSPFRPNKLGLSSVKLLSVEKSGPSFIIHVSGADVMDGTPVYDIKPYLPYVDSHTEASNGFAGERKSYSLLVDIPDDLFESITASEDQSAIRDILSSDPRPAYQNDPNREYGFVYGKYNIRFKVWGDTAHVIGIDIT